MLKGSALTAPAIDSIREGESAADYAIRVIEGLLTEENTDAAIAAAVKHLPHVPGFVQPILKAVLDAIMPGAVIGMLHAAVAKHKESHSDEQLPLGTPVHMQASVSGGGSAQAGDHCDPDTFDPSAPEYSHLTNPRCELVGDGMTSSWVIICD